MFILLKKHLQNLISSQISFDKRQHEARIQQLENEIHYLQENLKSMEEIQGLTDLQLQEADEEKERILAQLRELEKKVRKAQKAQHPCLRAWTLPWAGWLAVRGLTTVPSGSVAGPDVNWGQGNPNIGGQIRSLNHSKWKRQLACAERL